MADNGNKIDDSEVIKLNYELGQKIKKYNEKMLENAIDYDK